MKTKVVTTVAVLGMILAGCDRGPEEGAANPGTPAAVSAARGDESVAAVLLSAAPAPAQLRFLIAGRPVPGAPFTLRLDLEAVTPLPALQLTIAPAAEFSVEPVSVVLTLAQAGARASQEIVVTPARPGLASISVRLRAGDEGAEAEYAIPVLVGAVAP